MQKDLLSFYSASSSKLIKKRKCNEVCPDLSIPSYLVSCYFSHTHYNLPLVIGNLRTFLLAMKAW